MPADKLQITLAGREHVVEAGTTAGQALGGPGGLSALIPNGTVRGDAVVAARVNGELGTWRSRWPTVTRWSRSTSAAPTGWPSCGTPPRT